MSLLDGKQLAATVRREAGSLAAAFAEDQGREVSLHVVLVGEDPASEIYVRNKKRDCKKTGLSSVEHRLAIDTEQQTLLDLIARLNQDDRVDGMIVQLPLPPQIDPAAVIEAIDPSKDVDGFHPINLGRLVAGEPTRVPCTPLGCMKLIDAGGADLVGSAAVVIGRSTIVGKPMAQLLLARHATVTLCHSRTRDLDRIVAGADVVVAAIGRPELVRGSWIKQGSTVVDVGINRLEDGSLLGDVEFGPAAERAAWITPVPGGVGPMTRACLIENTVAAARARAGIK